MEARAIAQAFNAPFDPHVPFTQFPVANRSVHLSAIGIRAVRLPQNLPAQPASCIILAGLAGALDPSLQCGDIVIDPCPPGTLIHSTCRHGPIHTADRIVTTPAEKAQLHNQTKALAVDMEAATVRETARRLGIPFLNVRAIHDTAAEVLDPAVLDFIDDLGRPKPLALTHALLRQPGLISYLRHHQQASTLALHALGHALQQLLAGPGPWTSDP